MKVAIDGVRLTKKPTGVTDITISIINSIAQNYPEIELYILTYQNLSPEIATQIKFTKNVKLIVKPSFFFRAIGLFWSIFKLNGILRELRPDTFIAPNFLITPFFFPKGIRVVVYVHDLVFKKYPETMNLITKLNIRAFFKKTLKRADVVWTNSNYTKTELLNFFPSETMDKKLIMGGGVNQFFLEQIEIAPRASNTKYGKYLLFVGTIEPRKNVPFLLKLFNDIKDMGYSLVVVGDKGWGAIDKNFEEIYSLVGFPRDRIIYTGYVTLQELINLYRQASMLINTSLNEGLGLPLLEAMACGCPVVCPHNSAMIEVVEGAGLTVNTWDFDDWRNAILKVEENRQQLIAKGYARISDFDWDKIIKHNLREIIPGVLNK